MFSELPKKLINLYTQLEPVLSFSKYFVKKNYSKFKLMCVNYPNFPIKSPIFPVPSNLISVNLKIIHHKNINCSYYNESE